jgi:hypothetical protein
MAQYRYLAWRIVQAVRPNTNAWSYGLSDCKRRIFAALQADPVTSPREAVKAAMVAESGRQNEGVAG